VATKIISEPDHSISNRFLEMRRMMMCDLETVHDIAEARKRPWRVCRQTDHSSDFVEDNTSVANVVVALGTTEWRRGSLMTFRDSR
jgi:hypothetical protein